MQNIPSDLPAGPFTLAMAQQCGVSARMLTGRRFRRLMTSVYARADEPDSIQLLAKAALLVAPQHSLIASTSALRMYGITEVTDALLPVRLVSTHPNPIRRPQLHIRQVPVLPPSHQRVCKPPHALLTACSDLDLLAAVTAGDRMVKSELIDPAVLCRLAEEMSGRGAAIARRVASLVRSDVDSPRETRLRLCLVLCGLPEPDANPRLGSRSRLLGRRDLVYRRYRMLLEYEGDQHRVDRDQWEADISRHEAAAVEDWLVVRITNRRFATPRSLMLTIHNQLVERGYRGPRPVFSDEWCTLFE